MEYRIEADVPLPTSGAYSAGVMADRVATLKRMKPGDSVVVNGKAHRGEAHGFRLAARSLGIKVKTKTVSKSPEQTRIWRVS